MAKACGTTEKKYPKRLRIQSQLCMNQRCDYKQRVFFSGLACPQRTQDSSLSYRRRELHRVSLRFFFNSFSLFKNIFQKQFLIMPLKAIATIMLPQRTPLPVSLMTVNGSSVAQIKKLREKVFSISLYLIHQKFSGLYFKIVSIL